MRKHLTLLLLGLGAIAPCGAGIVTVDPLSHPSGTDISTSYVGLVMHKLRNPPGVTTYMPIASPVIAEPCTYGVCSGNGPFGTIGGISSNGHEAEHCYDVTLGGGSTSIDCGTSWNILELNFPGGTDFVQIDALWIIDAPAIIAYDSAGNELLYCKPYAFGVGGPPVAGSQPGCFTGQNLDSDGYMGTLHLQSGSALIARVVFASQLGSSVATRIQYNWINPRCTLVCKKKTLVKEDALIREEDAKSLD